MSVVSEPKSRKAHSGPVPSTPLVAIASVIVSMALVAIGNGLMFAYIPVRLGAEGFAPTWAGGILTGLSAGGIAGCLLTGVLVRRIGHARAYMVLSALIVLSNAGVAAGPHPVLWIAARALYGFAICAMFIVAQSWLNDAVGNSIRGRVMAVFYVSYIVGMGIGSAVMGTLDIGSPQAPLVGIAFTALSMLPIGMTRLAQPPAPEARFGGAEACLADIAGRHRRHVRRRRPVDDDRRLCADPRHGQGIHAAGSGDAYVLPCRSARCSSRFRSAGSRIAPTAAMC